MYTDLKIKLGSAIHEQTKLQLTTFLTAISGGPLLFKETLHFVEYPKKAISIPCLNLRPVYFVVIGFVINFTLVISFASNLIFSSPPVFVEYQWFSSLLIQYCGIQKVSNCHFVVSRRLATLLFNMVSTQKELFERCSANLLTTRSQSFWRMVFPSLKTAMRRTKVDRVVRLLRPSMRTPFIFSSLKHAAVLFSKISQFKISQCLFLKRKSPNS